MDNLPIALILICGGGIITTGLATSMLLYRHMLEPMPKRDLTIHANIWPLTLPESCFTDVGKNIRKVALAITITLVAIAVLTLLYVGSVLWLG